MSGLILHALKSAARLTKGFAVARPNARADPQRAVALWTHAGGRHVLVQNRWSLRPVWGKGLPKGGPDSVK